MLIHKTAPIFTSLDLPRRAGFPILGAPTGPPGTASEQQCTVALCKNIVGTGVLTLPAGVSHLSDAGASSSDALIVATIATLIFCVINAYGFFLIGEACCATRQASYVGAWRRTLGPEAAFIPALASLLLCFTAGVSCLTVIADIFTDLAAGAFSINYASLDKNLVLTSISAAALLPLCLLPSLAPLGTASVAGVAGVFITGGAMLSRLVDGSYETGGAYADAAIWTPSFHAAGLPAAASMAAPSLDALSQASTTTATASLPDIGSLCFFASLLSNAFLAHYNAPSIYSELAAMPLPSAAAAATAMEVDAAATAPAATSVESGGGGASEQEQSVLVDRLKAAVRAEAVNANFRAFIESTKLYWQERVGTSNGKGGSSRDERAYAPGGADAETTATTATVAAAVADTAEDEAMMANSILDIDPLEAARLAAFKRVVTYAFTISGGLFLLIAGAGFATFGDSSQPLILANYASSDPLAAVARVGVGACVLFEFPLLERPFRLTAMQLLGLEAEPGTPMWTASAIASVTLLVAVAAIGVPLDVISAVSGSSGGALLIYIAPALMALRLIEQQQEGEVDVGSQQGRVLLLKALAGLGVVLCIIGSYEALVLG